jgi:hypothetical protein
MPVNPDDRQISDEELLALFSSPIQLPERIVPALIYDEGVDQRSIGLVKQRIDLFVTTVQKQGLAQETSDFRILAAARQQIWTLVVEDKAFRTYIPERLMGLGLSHAGIILVRKYLPPQRLCDFIEMGYRRCIEKDTNIFIGRLWEVR